MSTLYKNAHKMPWKMNDGPHASLDILRGCNCKCDACYNNAECKIKPYEEVLNDFKALKRLRNISAIDIIGGEPLMHPDLFKIIKYLKEENMIVEVLTNGILVDENTAAELAKSGVNIVYLHIDTEQKRPDIKNMHDKSEVNALRTNKAKMLCSQGIETAMSITIEKKEKGSALPEYLKYFRESPYINYVLMTLYKDYSDYGKLHGNVKDEVYGNPHKPAEEEPEMNEITEYFKKNEKLNPYWYVESKHNPDNPRWVSYMYAASYNKKGVLKHTHGMKYSRIEGWYILRYRNKKGKYPYLQMQSKGKNIFFILINAIGGGDFWGNIMFLLKSWNCNIKLKRIFVQEPASVNKNGVLDFCESCPDATIKNGKLVPVCVSDCFEGDYEDTGN